MYDTNLPELVGKLPYFDTIAVWIEDVPDDAIVSQLRKLCRHLHVETDPKKIWREDLKCRLDLNGPKNPAFGLLRDIVGEGSYCINKVHVTLDLCVKTAWEADVLGRFVKRTLVKLWNGNQCSKYYETTKYLAEDSWGVSNIVIYSDLYSKVVHLPCTHIEWRSNGSSQVRQAGVKSFDDLLTFDFNGFWRKRLVLEWIDAWALGRKHAGRRRVLPPKVIGTRNGGFIYDSDYRAGMLLLRHFVMDYIKQKKESLGKKRWGKEDQDEDRLYEAQDIRLWLHEVAGYQPRDVMVRLDNECLLPNPNDNVREMCLTLEPLQQSIQSIRNRSKRKANCEQEV